MKNLVKNSIYGTVGALSLGLSSVNAAINPISPIDEGIRESGTADIVIQRYVSNLLFFLYLVAVLYGLWGGFNILTAGGDEEKVKKGKTIIIQALLGIVVIFLVGTIVEWLITLVLQK